MRGRLRSNYILCPKAITYQKLARYAARAAINKIESLFLKYSNLIDIMYGMWYGGMKHVKIAIHASASWRIKSSEWEVSPTVFAGLSHALSCLAGIKARRYKRWLRYSVFCLEKWREARPTSIYQKCLPRMRKASAYGKWRYYRAGGSVSGVCR